MPRFHVFKRVRRGEFRYAIVNEFGREVGNIGNEDDARQIVRIMNSNAELTPEKIEAVDFATRGESVRPHLIAALTAREWLNGLDSWQR